MIKIIRCLVQLQLTTTVAQDAGPVTGRIYRAMRRQLGYIHIVHKSFTTSRIHTACCQRAGMQYWGYTVDLAPEIDIRTLNRQAN